MPDLSGISIDRYHIIEPLGQGGMANVYKAYDTRLERNVAIKFIRRDAFSPDVLDMVLKRFDREAKSLAKLTHPNIVGIIDYGEYEGSPYLVMPYLQGGTLKQYLGTPMSIEKAASLLEPVADALAFAHQKGIVHRDVKPANILITEGGKPMLTDFGIARLLESGDGATLTGTGMGVGTPEYMSPEQAMGREVDGRTDIYSLGIVLFELVTGRKPYTADTPMAVVLKQTTEPLPRPSSIVPGITDTVEQILYKSLAKDPKDRYQSMTEFSEALSKFSKWEAQLPTQPAMPVVPESPEENLPTVQEDISAVRAEINAKVPPLPEIESSSTKMALQQKKEPPAKIPVPIVEGMTPVKKKMVIWPFIAGGVALVAIIAVLFATNVLGPKKSPTATTEQTAVAQPTNAPTSNDQGSSQSSQPVEVTLWYPFEPNYADGLAFKKILAQAATDLPGIKITAVQITSTEIFDKYYAALGSGSGPDLFIAENERVDGMAREGSIADITDLAAGKLQGINRLGLEGMAVDGKLYGIPESLWGVALWYNKDLLPIPPTTTDQLKSLMESGKQAAISYGCYHHYGFYGAFGGQIFDANWKIIADQSKGTLDAMTYLKQLYQISSRNSWTTTDVDGLAAFTTGKAALFTNGNWVLGNLKEALGDKLAVIALPAGPGGPATPMIGVDGFYLNPNSQKKEAALQVALFLTNTASQTVMMNMGGHVPVRTDVNITDPLIKNLTSAFNKGATSRPMTPQLNRYWENFCDGRVFENGVSPADWLKTATANANK
jgi:serine/threonine protein kinase